MGKRRPSSRRHPWEGQDLRTTQTYPVSPMGGSSPPDYPDLPGVTHGRVQSFEPGLDATKTYLAIGIRMERKAARYSASPMGGSSAPDHPDSPGNRHEDWMRKAARYSASPMGGSSAPDHPDLPGNRHGDGAKGGQVLSVSHRRVQPPGPPGLTWQ